MSNPHRPWRSLEQPSRCRHQPTRTTLIPALLSRRSRRSSAPTASRRNMPATVDFGHKALHRRCVRHVRHALGSPRSREPAGAHRPSRRGDALQPASCAGAVRSRACAASSRTDQGLRRWCTEGGQLAGAMQPLACPCGGPVVIEAPPRQGQTNGSGAGGVPKVGSWLGDAADSMPA